MQARSTTGYVRRQNWGFAAGFKILIASIAFLLPVELAFADIGAFNAAIKSGDYKKAAAEAKSVCATYDKSSDDTALLAREFGFVSYVAGDFTAARDYGLFLKEQGASLAKPDDVPATSAVLLASSDLRLSPTPAARSALRDALAVRRQAPGIDNITVLAAEALYRAEWAAGAFTSAESAAEVAMDMFARAGATLQFKKVEAQTFAAAANFVASPRREDYERMASAHDAIVAAYDDAAETQRPALGRLIFVSEAWLDAIEAYVGSTQQTGSNIPKGVEKRELREVKINPYPVKSEAGEPCKGQWDVGKVTYPSSAAFKGLVGAVILRLTLNADGQVTDSEVMAAVPAGEFGPHLQRQADRIQLKRAPDDPEGCTLAQSNRMLRATFMML